MPELTADSLAVARPLFRDLSRLQVAAGAVLDGEAEGRVFVDDPQRPRSGLVTSPEGTVFAGDPDNERFVGELRRFVWDELFARAGWDSMYATVDRAGWEARIARIAAPRTVFQAARRHYECRAPAVAWRAVVPDGFAVRAVDAPLLDDPSWVVPDHLRHWIASNWGSRERFLARGFGVVTVQDRAVVSWSLADARSGDRCEIGIQTLQSYRRRGLATATAAAAVETGLAMGFRVVGWHCDEDNDASFRTAERVGFALERRYTAHYFYADEADELAERGWRAFRGGRPQETAALFARVFALRPDAPGSQYVLAARASAAFGDLDAAIARLNEAVDRGWADPEAMESFAELGPLWSTPAWRTLLDRMRSGR